MPIIELQRRMVEAGRIRAGDKGTKGEPRKLDKWRLTSKDKVRLERAAELWGGEVREWEGQFELYTETDTLPIMLLPESEPSLYYEQWSRGGCQRRCDGVTELLSDGPCLCNGEEGDRACKPHLRFSVLLPDLPGIGSWLVQSLGFNAAREIPGSIALLTRGAAQGVVMPARLRLEQCVEIKDGKTRRYAKPVIDIDVSFRELLGGNQGGLPTPSDRPALPSGYVPLAGNGGNGVSLAEGLTAAETQTVARTARSSAPIPAQDDLDFGGAPLPSDESGASPSPQSSEHPPSGGTPSDAPAPAEDKPLTHHQANKKMDAIIGQLREAGKIETLHLYQAVAGDRNIVKEIEVDGETKKVADVETMAAFIDGAYGEDGELHWAPLRENLTLKEARLLHARLANMWLRVEANLPKAAA